MRHEILPHESSDLIMNNLYDDVSVHGKPI
jgi:hypothetical protein